MNNFAKNFLIVTTVIVIIVELFYLFEIFIDHQIMFSTVGPASANVIVIINLLLAYNRIPTKNLTQTPNDLQNPRENIETK